MCRSRARPIRASPSDSRASRVGPQGSEASHDAARVAERYAAVGAEHLGQSTHRRGHHGHPLCHRLQGRVGRELVVARGHEHRSGTAEQSANALGVHLAEELDLAPGAGSQRLEPGAIGPVTGHAQRYAGPGGGIDRHVDALLRREPRRHQRVVALARPRVLREGIARQIVRQHLHALAREAQHRHPVGSKHAGCEEQVDRRQHPRLVQRQRGGVHRGLGQRAAAVEHQAREGAPPPAARARPAVALAEAGGAEQPHVVQVEDHLGSRAARCFKPPRADQRQHVVRVNDRGIELAHGGRHVVHPGPTAQQRAGRSGPAGVGGAAFQQRVRDARLAERLKLKLGRALLPADDAVAVV